MVKAVLTFVPLGDGWGTDGPPLPAFGGFARRRAAPVGGIRPPAFHDVRSWRNWETRSVEVAVAERPWKFESSRPHQNRRFVSKSHSQLALVERLSPCKR